MTINRLRAIETFAKAVELGSLRQAALAQGVTPQAASQALAQLEAHLGVRLLHRTTRRLSLTDEGRELLESTQPALDVLERALERARNARDATAGPLRIAGPKSAFAPVLWPVIDDYCRQHPGVRPEVMLDDGIGNWVADRVDVGFRIGGPPEDGLIARMLFPFQLLICAAPSYLERHGAPRSLDDLASHRCSVFRHANTGHVMPWYADVDGEIVQRHVPPALVTNDIELELQATLTGQVMSQVSAMSAAALIRARKLVPVLLPHMTSHLKVSIYYGSRIEQPRRVRSFIDFTLARLSMPAEFVLSAQELREAASVKAASFRTRSVSTGRPVV